MVKEEVGGGGREAGGQVAGLWRLFISSAGAVARMMRATCQHKMLSTLPERQGNLKWPHHGWHAGSHPLMCMYA